MAEIELKGAFLDSLKRNNGQIKAARAAAIGEDTEIAYRRKVEDLESKIKKVKRRRDNMLDLSPESTDSLILAKDFKEDEFVAEDIRLSSELRNLTISLEIAKGRYDFLFGYTEGNK